MQTIVIHTIYALPAMPPGTMRGFTVLYMQSSPFVQGTYVQSMGIRSDHSLRRTIHGLSRPYFAHGTIHGLRAQSTDYCAICGSIDCAGQSTDCLNPYFAHNIYIVILHIRLMIRNTWPYSSLLHGLYDQSGSRT